MIGDGDIPPFIGSLWVNGVPRTAFACHRTKILVTCAHDFPASINGVALGELTWKRFADEKRFDLSGSRVLILDPDDDVLVLLAPLQLVEIPDLPEQPPTRIFRHGIEVCFYGVGLYQDASGPVWHDPDSGDGTVLGPGGVAGRLLKFRTQNVTKGFSGAPLLYFSDAGVHILGMVSGRYNSGGADPNRDTSWAVQPSTLRYAVSLAVEVARGLQPDDLTLVMNTSLDFDKLTQLLHRNSGNTKSSPQGLSIEAGVNSPREDSQIVVSRIRDFWS